MAWKEWKFNLVTSLESISELIKVLKDFKIRLSDELIKEWVDLIIRNSKLIKIENKLDVIKEHFSDNVFLEIALTGYADYIVTQDRHLLKLKEFKGIKIIRPEDFLKLI